MIIRPYVIIKTSKIHSRGLFAKVNIKKNRKIVEYIGSKKSKKEGFKIQEIQYQEWEKNKSKGMDYIFELNKGFSIDGNTRNNVAKYINHSCEPNCEVKILKNRIWIFSKRVIKKEDELTYNYGYDLEDFKKFRRECRCGAKKCIGYMIAQNMRKKVILQI